MQMFSEISLLLILVFGVSMVMRWLKQPLIVGYILSGIVAGPYVLGLITDTEPIELFSKIGIASLLFIVGLSMSPKVIKEVGKVSLITGVGQVLFTSLIGYGIAIFLGQPPLAALYIAIALTFSSTIIILKLLSDRGDVDKLYGKVAIGFLLVQDIIATMILLFVSAGSSGDTNIYSLLGVVLLKGIIVFGALWVVSLKIIPKMIRYAAGSSELLFIFALAWGLGMGSLFDYIGFSLEIGTLIAGVSLSVSPFASEMSARMKPLRDFFIILFFVLLGSHMVLDTLVLILIPALILSVFVLVGNPVIVMILMNLLGYRRRTGFMAGLTVAQISEFSLILATLGFNLGHLPKETLSLITLVGLITIAGSTYLILYADPIYKKINKILRFLELKKIGREKSVEEEVYDAYLFGYGRVGDDYIETFKKLGMSYLVIDHDPKAVERLIVNQVSYRFGDVEDLEFLEELALDRAKLVITTIPEYNANHLLIRYIKSVNKKCMTVVTSHNIEEAKSIYSQGADYVIMPHYLGAKYGASLMKKIGLDRMLLASERKKHEQFLSSRAGV